MSHRFAISSRFKRSAILSIFFLGGILSRGLALRAQEPGIRHVVINELAAANQADHAIEIYNYGLDQPLNGWQLQYQTLVAAPIVTYAFPGAFVLPRHATVTVHYGPGSNTATDLFTGSTESFGNSGGEVLLKDGTTGIDFMKFGSPPGTSIKTPDLSWIGSSVSWPTSTSGLARQHDVNTRSADDWNQPLPPNDGSTPGQLNSKQVGTRLYAPLLVNEFNRTNQQVEIYNPNNFTVNLSGLVLRGGQGAVDSQCGFVNLAGTLGAGARQLQTISGCGAWSVGSGTISIRDSATPANNWDFVSFNRGIGDLTMGGTTNIGYRKSDVPTASLSDWVVQNGSPSFGALNPGQQGPMRYDELGAVTSPSTPYAGAANSGAGMQMDLTRAVSFREIRVRMTTGATQAQIALYRLSGLPNSWTRVGSAFNLTPVAGEQVYTTGPINVNFNSPDTILAMVFADAAFALQQAPPAERFSFGYVAGLNTFAAFPPPPGPVGMTGLDPAKAVQFYFWSQPGPAVTPEAAIKAGEVNLAYNQQFASNVGTPAFTWSANTLPPGLGFMPATQTMNGTPTAAGAFAGVQVSSTDSIPMTDTNIYTLDIYNELLWNTLSPLPDGEVGVNYPLVPLSASGGPPGGYNWSVVIGALPTGLSLEPTNGNLTGLAADPPVTAQSVTIRVQDQLGVTKDRAFLITTHPRLTVSTVSLPPAQQGVNYNQTLAYTGGAPGAVNWTIAFGALPVGVSLTPATGQLSGIPTAPPGSYVFTVQATDSLGGVSGRGLTLQVNGLLDITTGSLPDGEAGYSYSQTLMAASGNGLYNWAALSGLPGFCTLDAGTGVLSCPSPTAGAVSLAVRLTDTAGGLVDRTFNFQFVAPPSITTAALPAGEISAAYNQPMAVSGGLAPYSWSATGLPPGLSIANLTGVINGTPTATGIFNINITVTDNVGASASRLYSGVPVVDAVQITTPAGPLGAAEVGVPFSASFTWSGGQGPATFTLDFGTLPAGLTLSPAGAITGTPAAASGNSLIIRITDALGGTDTKVYNIQVAAPPAILNTTLPKGVVQVAYPAINLITQGGIPPYSYAIIAGLLPTGVTLNAGTGQFGGTPTQIETVNPTFRVTDSLGGVVTRAITIQVIDPPLPTDWSRRAQFSGGVGQIILAPGYHAVNKPVAFVTADQAGEFFRSVDRGFTWQPFLVDGDNSGAPIHSLRLSPDFDYNTGTGVFSGAVYVSTGAGGVYRSVDGGATFVNRNAGLPNIISADGPQTSAIAISPAYATDNTVWVVAQSGTLTKLYRSTTIPEAWNEIFTFTGSAAGVPQLEASPNLAADNTLFAVYDGSVYKGINRGTAWTSVYTPPFIAGRMITHILISPNYATTPAIFAEDNQRNFFRSLDAGATWEQLPIQGYNLAFGDNGAGALVLFFKAPGGTYALVKSEDLGNTFVPVYATGMQPSGPTTGPAFHSMLSVGGVSGDIYSGTQAGLTVSNDGGNVFFPRQTGLATIKAKSISGAGNFVIAATDGGFLRSRDGGLTFIQTQKLHAVSPPEVIELPNLLLAAVSPSFAQDKTFFLSVTSNFGSAIPTLYRTTDGGFTFTSVMYNDCRTIAFVPGFDSRTGQPERTMYAGCLGGLFRSTDGGATFLGLSSANGMDPRCNQSTQTETDGLGLSPRLSGGYTLYRSGDQGICISDDSGASWSILLGGGGAPYIGTISSPATPSNSITPVDRLRLRVDFLAHRIYYSTDLATTVWNTVQTPSNTDLVGIVFARAFFSPNYSLDRLALIAVNRSFAAPGGLYRFDANTGIATPLATTDPLHGRIITGIYMPSTFNGNNVTGSVALVTTQGGGLYRSTDGARTFQPVSRYDFASANVRGMSRASGGALGLADGGKFIGPQAPTATGAGTLFNVGDDGVFASDDGGITFDDISAGLPEAAVITAIAVPSQATSTALVAVQDAGLWHYDGTIWSAVAGYTTGNYTNFNEDASNLYATRSDGASIKADLTGNNWSVLASGAAEDLDLQMASDESVEAVVGGGSKPKMQGPRLPSGTTGTTAPLWSVSLSAGPRYSSNSGSSWTTSSGGNDYTLPAAASGNYKVVAALGLNAASGSREVIVGHNGGLYKTTDGGDTWRSVYGTGSGLEATSKNFTAILKSGTAYGTTDVLVGVSGTSTTGGVYISGDGGEHWTQLNAGYDTSNLSITSLIHTSCSGCPVQYYSGSYGGGMYTRTVTVSPPPFYTTGASWCTGSGCTCGAGAFTGPEEGGQAFKICGSNFLSGAVIEFDGVPVYTNYSGGGCTLSATQISCPAGASGTPAHIPGAAQVRIRNSDTRATNLSTNYTFVSSTPRTTSLTVAKSGGDAALTWSCTGCDSTHPARLYRAQNTAFSTYLEIYNGGTGGTYTNTGALSSAQSYFWNVE